jgi:nitrilase
MNGSSGSRVVAAIVQVEAPTDFGAALARLRAGVADACGQGARLVVFGETWLPGYPAWLDVCRDAGLWDHEPVKRVYRRLVEASIEVPGPETQAFGAVAREFGCTLVLGVSERIRAGAGRGTLYNVLLTFGPDGRLLNHHRKLMPTYTERLLWGGGDAAGLRAVDTPAGRVGGLVCWEHWMPLARQALHESGEDVHVAAWPMVKEMNQVASRHYAFEGRCFVLAAGTLLRATALPPELEPDLARVSSDGWVLRGGSQIFGPDGSSLAGPVFDGEAVLVAELDFDRAREERMTLDVTGHYSRPDCLRLDRPVPAVPRAAAPDA